MQNLIFLKPNQKKIIEINLDKSGQKQENYILFVGKKDQTFSLKTHITHSSPKTLSKTIVRGVLFNNARTQIKGSLQSFQNSYNSQAILDQHILLIGKNSNAIAKPFLEIGQKNIKASHKSKLSHLDNNYLTYLKSRGFDLKKAQRILIKSFFHDLLDKIDSKTDKKIFINYLKNLNYA